MLLQDYDSKVSIIDRLGSNSCKSLLFLKDWYFPYQHVPLLLKECIPKVLRHIPFPTDPLPFPVHENEALLNQSPFNQDFEKIKKKIETDDANNNYVFHLQTKETLMENIRLDASLHLKIEVEGSEPNRLDNATSSVVSEHAYDYMNSGISNFYKVDTYYHHWQLKDNVLIDPINEEDITFINNTKILSLNTSTNSVTEICDFKHKIVNFDISEDFIVACGYRVMSSYPREYTHLFFNEFERPLGQTAPFKSAIPTETNKPVIVPSDEDGKHFRVLRDTKKIDESTSKGALFIFNRKTGISYECAIGVYMNNAAKILNNNKLKMMGGEDTSPNDDLNLLVSNNNGFLYYIQFSLDNYRYVGICPKIPDLSTQVSLNNIAIDDSYTHILLTTDSNSFYTAKLEALEKLFDTECKLQYFTLNCETWFAPSGSFAMKARFFNNSTMAVVSYQNGRVHLVDIDSLDKRNIVLPFRHYEEAIRNVVIDSNNNIYISQNSGAVHIYTREQLSTEWGYEPKILSHHKQLNFPKSCYLHHLEETALDGESFDTSDSSRQFVKQKIAPYESNSYDLWNISMWVKDRLNVMIKVLYKPDHFSFSKKFIEVIHSLNRRRALVSLDNENLDPELIEQLLNEDYEELFKMDKLVMQERDFKYLGILIENEVKINRYYNCIAHLYPETYKRIMDMQNCDLTELLPFDKIMTRAYTPYQYDLHQYAKLSILKRDSKLYKTYKQKFPTNNGNFIINTPSLPEDYHPSEKVKIESKSYEELIVNTLNEPENVSSKKNSFGEDIGEYEDYQFCILSAFKSVNMDKKNKYEDNPNNKITGMCVRQVGSEEQLVVGTSSGIYTIPIIKN